MTKEDKRFFVKLSILNPINTAVWEELDGLCLNEQKAKVNRMVDFVMALLEED